MKKKMIRRILAMALIVCVATAIATTASAGTYNWVVGNTSYTAYVGKTSSNAQSYYASSSYGYCTHTSGTATTLAVTKTFSFLVSANVAFPAAYSTYLNKAMTNEGLKSSHTYTIVSGSKVTVAMSAPSGRYAAKGDGPAYNAEYSVTSISIQSVNDTMSNTIVQPMALASGTLSHAPTGGSAILKYYKLS